MGVSGTLQMEGKKNGSQEFIINTNSGFVGSTATNNGFTEIDLTTYGGSNNSNTAIDELVLSMGGNFQYVAFDAFTWEPSTSPVSAAITSQTNVSCRFGSDGSLTATGSSGTSPYTYAWSTGATTATISNLSSTTYTITVTDAAASTATASAFIIQPSQLQATATTASNVSCNGDSNGSASTTAQGGTSPYTYSWNNGSTSNPATSLLAGTYTVSVTDNNGCGPSTSQVTITEPTAMFASVAIDSNVSCNGF